jgi:hypothetical protein
MTGTFLKEKFLPTGEFKKLKARLVAGVNQQDKELYENQSATTFSFLQLCWSQSSDEKCSDQFDLVFDEVYNLTLHGLNISAVYITQPYQKVVF